MRFAFLLLLTVLLSAADREQFTLRDGRVLVGTYDEQSQTMKIDGGSFTVKPSEIVKRDDAPIELPRTVTKPKPKQMATDTLAEADRAVLAAKLAVVDAQSTLERAESARADAILTVCRPIMLDIIDRAENKQIPADLLAPITERDVLTHAKNVEQATTDKLSLDSINAALAEIANGRTIKTSSGTPEQVAGQRQRRNALVSPVAILAQPINQEILRRYERLTFSMPGNEQEIQNVCQQIQREIQDKDRAEQQVKRDRDARDAQFAARREAARHDAEADDAARKAREAQLNQLNQDALRDGKSGKGH